jgi:hypothetical protein
MATVAGRGAVTSNSGQGSDSLDRRVRRWAGWFGVGGFVVFLVALPLYFIGVGPAARLEDTAQYSDLITKTNTFILIRTAVADPLISTSKVGPSAPANFYTSRIPRQTCNRSRPRSSRKSRSSLPGDFVHIECRSALSRHTVRTRWASQAVREGTVDPVLKSVSCAWSRHRPLRTIAPRKAQRRT